MAVKKITPHGDWETPITVEAVSSKSRSISAPRICPKTKAAYFIQSRETGKNTVMRVEPDGIKEVLPQEHSVYNTVYEYGISKYEVLHDGRIIFAEGSAVHILDPETQKVTLLVERANLRYGSFSPNPKSSWVLAIEEDHTHDTPREIKNYIVAIDLDTSEVKRVVTGADFYFQPKFSVDGSELVWLEWNHPEMLFSAARLYRADWNKNASVTNSRLLVGADIESVAEPRWGPDGSLFFGKEVSGYRQLFRIAPGSGKQEAIKLHDDLKGGEFGEMSLMEASHSYVPLHGDRIVANVIFNGVCKLIVIDISTGNWRRIANDDTAVHSAGDAVAGVDSSVYVVSKGVAAPPALYFIDLDHPKRNKTIQTSIDDDSLRNYYSKPETLSFQSRGAPSRPIHGFLWMPSNPKHQAPEGELPPLIVDTHGGPTGYRGSGLMLRVQFFTSRGYAYLQLNYTGSTGYGREYRESLFGNWGIVDAADASEAAEHLTSQGRVKMGAVGITGHSAGGYNTLQCITRHPKTFAGGVCIAGISDLKTFDDTTHKLESDYASALVLPKQYTEEEKAKIFHDRSAMNHIDKIETPLLLLHGVVDTVVPIAQARIIADALTAKGRDVKIVEYEGEDHMMSMPSTERGWFTEEEKWWRKTLLGRE